MVLPITQAFVSFDTSGEVALVKYTPVGYILYMDSKTRKIVDSRLARIEGQVKGLRKMVEMDRYCIDILTQTSAVVSALKSVEEIVMEHHLHSCVAHAMQQDDPQEKQVKIEEVMEVISRFRK